MKRVLVLLIAAVLSLGLMTACEKGEAKMGLEWHNNPSSKEEWMDNARITSLTNLGNTYRLKNAIEKAKKGEDVTIAYIGGSITEGDNQPTSYASRSYNYFVETFAKNPDKCHYVNAGISGTPSVLGSLRLENDVLSHNPDIVFVEYAVNDGGEPIYYDAYDSIIRECLGYESKPAVILLFARMEEGWTSQDWKKQIGAHYDVSMISYADGITYLFDNNVMQWSEFSNDYAHPHAEGNAVVADFIAYFYDEVNRLDAPATDINVDMIDSMYAEFYMGAHMLTNDNSDPADLGTWKKGSSGFHYSDGWTKTWDDRNGPLVFEFTGKHAYVVYPASGTKTFGTLVANVYFNGELVDTVEFNEYLEGGWNCPYVGTLHHSPKVGDYRIEFTAKEDNVKCDLQVLAVAYTDK